MIRLRSSASVQSDMLSTQELIKKCDVKPENVFEVEIRFRFISETETTQIAASVNDKLLDLPTPTKAIKHFGEQNPQYRAYKNFLHSVRMALEDEDNGFQLVEEVPSNSTMTSKYFFGYKKDKDGNPDEKYLIVIRISDHWWGESEKRPERRKALEKRGRDAVRKTANELGLKGNIEIEEFVTRPKKGIFKTWREVLHAIFDFIDDI